MITEQRTALKSSFDSFLKSEKRNYILSMFKTGKTSTHALLHELESGKDTLSLASKKLVSGEFEDRASFEDFKSKITQTFENLENPTSRNFLLKLKEILSDDIWINPNYTFDNNKKKVNNNPNNKKINFNHISVYKLFEENASGESILSQAGLIKPFSRLKNEGEELKIKFTFMDSNQDFNFSLNTKTNSFSNWKKGAGALGGFGAKNFLSKAFNMDDAAVNKFLSNVARNHSSDDLIIEVDHFSFKTSTPMPIEGKKEEDINKVVDYIYTNRAIDKNIAREMINKGVVAYSSMIRAPKDSRYKATRKNAKGEEYLLNTPKSSVNKDQMYFPLKNTNGEFIAAQRISLDPNFNMKLNMGSTYGITSSIEHENARRYVLSESAFDNIALYEILKTKNIDVSKYNLLSGQSVGGIETWIESKFGVVFDKNEDDEIVVKKANISTSTRELSQDYAKSFVQEMIGQNKDDSRRFVLVDSGKDPIFTKRLEQLSKALKKLSSDIEIVHQESPNRFLNIYEYKPLDIILDSSSLDTWLTRNSFDISSGTLKQSVKTVTLEDFSSVEIQSMRKKHKIECLISGCDNDSAGRETTAKLKLFCKKFGIPFWDWTPEDPNIKDHNDALRLSKGISLKSKNENNEEVLLNIDQISTNSLFSYVDEQKIKSTVVKKKAITKIF